MASGFARSFADKGCMSDYLKGIPVWLVTAPYPGLTGAGVALQGKRSPDGPRELPHLIVFTNRTHKNNKEHRCELTR
jgi:glucokinase